MLLLNKKLFLAVIIETVPSLFYLHTLCTQFTAILISIDGQYSQSVVFRFEKGCDCQNHSSSDSHSQLKKSSPSNFLIAPHTGRIPYYPLTPFGKPCVIPQSQEIRSQEISQPILLFYENLLKCIATARGECTIKHKNKASYNTD